jgi:hypothetical protein
MTRTFFATLIGLCATAALAAHHSMGAEFDVTRTVEVKGTVTRVEWRNPHPLIHFTVTGPDGTRTEWQAEAQGAPHELERRGWSRTSIAAGEVIVARGFPEREPRPKQARILFMRELTKADGTTLDATSTIWGQPQAALK